MLKNISWFLNKVAGAFNKTAQRIYTQPISEYQKTVNKWFAEEGDRTHRLDYNLNENSIVFDLGGYQGQWSSDIFSKYSCTVFIFEPFEKYSENIKQRFQSNNRIKTFPFGLAEKNKIEKLSILADGSSMFRAGTDAAEIKLVEAKEFIQQNNILKIDLMKINIEGGEYDLLNHLIATDLVKNIQNIQVQFHDVFPDAEARMKDIQNELSKTHLLTYQYKFMWENWQKL